MSIGNIEIIYLYMYTKIYIMYVYDMSILYIRRKIDMCTHTYIYITHPLEISQ